MRKKLLILSLALLGAVVLSACGGPIRGTTWSGLAADETTAYLADVSVVYGVNLNDGREAWRFSDREDSKAQFYATPLVTPDGLVVIGSASGKHILYALNPKDTVADGDVNNPVPAWTFTGAQGAWVAAPLVVDNLLFAPNSDGNLYVIDLSDGRSQKQPVKVIELAGRLWAQPVTDGERVFITSLDHSVFAVDIPTLELVWHEDVSGAIPGSPIIGADEKLYVGSLDSKLEQFDPVIGGNQPVFDAKDWIWSTPVLDGDTLYFGDLDGNFYSYNTSTGDDNWSIQPDGAITAGVILQNDYLLLATESGNIYAIDKDGKVKWFEEVGGKIYTTPVSAGGLTLIAPLETDFFLAAYEENLKVWEFIPEN